MTRGIFVVQAIVENHVAARQSGWTPGRAPLRPTVPRLHLSQAVFRASSSFDASHLTTRPFFERQRNLLNQHAAHAKGACHRHVSIRLLTVRQRKYLFGRNIWRKGNALWLIESPPDQICPRGKPSVKSVTGDLKCSARYCFAVSASRRLCRSCAVFLPCCDRVGIIHTCNAKNRVPHILFAAMVVRKDTFAHAASARDTPSTVTRCATAPAEHSVLIPARRPSPKRNRTVGVHVRKELGVRPCASAKTHRPVLPRH